MFKIDLEKAEEPEIKLPTSVRSSKKQEFQKNIYFIHLTCLVRNPYAGQEVTEPEIEQTSSKLGKE